ncbi:MAG: response regulator [Ktedonobacteraceae bacterium]
MTSMLDLQGYSSETTPEQVILLVEDDVDIGEFITISIESETPYRVLSMNSGEETIQRIQEVKEVRPNLFILDLWLHAMGAIELYDRLHGLAGFKHVPAIIITASTPDLGTEAEIVERGIKLLPKPFEVEDFLRCVEQAIERNLQIL